jgi:NitT/TauT family transport system ATP-binding protein
LRALVRAAQWCTNPANHDELAHIIARPGYLDRPVEWMLPALTGTLHASRSHVLPVPEFFVPYAKAATFPWKSHALWFYSQMVRWRQVAHTDANAAIARGTYRPDLYRTALASSGIALPVANAKVEGALKVETPVGSAGASLLLGPVSAPDLHSALHNNRAHNAGFANTLDLLRPRANPPAISKTP